MVAIVHRPKDPIQSVGRVPELILVKDRGAREPENIEIAVEQ